jgi:hypothetical protein
VLQLAQQKLDITGPQFSNGGAPTFLGLSEKMGNKCETVNVQKLTVISQIIANDMQMMCFQGQ